MNYMNQQKMQDQSGAGKVKVKVEGESSHLKRITSHKSKKAHIMYSSNKLPSKVSNI